MRRCRKRRSPQGDIHTFRFEVKDLFSSKLQNLGEEITSVSFGNIGQENVVRIL